MRLADIRFCVQARSWRNGRNQNGPRTTLLRVSVNVSVATTSHASGGQFVTLVKRCPSIPAAVIRLKPDA